MDLLSHSNHCGACGVVCGAPEVCVNGACGCPAGGGVCDGVCVELASDEQNCGSCGEACSGDSTCVDGACTCPAGRSLCDAGCFDLRTSQASCGVCGNDCLPVEDCSAGSCVFGGADGDGCGNAARGVDIVRVALYQAVEVPLVAESELVLASSRDAVIVAGRDAAVRVFVNPAPSFAPRELSARLTLKKGSETHVLFDRGVISGDSAYDDVSSTLVIDVPGELLDESSQFRVDLVECEGLRAGKVGAVRFPSEPEQLTPLGVTVTGSIRVAFVPVIHDGLAPDTSPEALALYTAIVEKEFPTTEVITSLTGAIDSAQNGPDYDFYTGVDEVWEKRAVDGPDPDVYYFGLIRPMASLATFCSGGCTLGIAFVAGSGTSGASDRVGLGVGYVDPGPTDSGETDDRYSIETFLHELGHTHGRDHVDCGDPDDPDQNYPYGPPTEPDAPAGSIGVWGYDVVEGEPKDPDVDRDFMGYCDPYWVSDYTWNAIGARITNVNGLAGREWSGGAEARVVGAGEPQPAASVRYRVISVQSSVSRWLGPVVELPPPSHAAESATILGATGQELLEVAVHRVMKSEGGGSLVYVPAPLSDWVAIRLGDGSVVAFE